MNRLAHESSPYLKQHQENPVDWYPWGAEALSRAKAEKKPILLSVGYSACHWCHVMERESFENEEIARAMNENFICIKVDREERPDLDHIYQPVAQALTGGGGWPLTVFLTPELRPFFGGTYFPPQDAYGRPGFKRLVEALAHAWRNDPQAIQSNSSQLYEMLAAVEAGPDWARGAETIDAASLERWADRIVEEVDPEHGGLGGAPKFPNPMVFTYLWRMGRRDPVLHTLRKMARGGIYDQLGGGFHRYSVDAHWRVPHYEKMLYDNGLLLQLYSEVVLSGGLAEDDRALFIEIIRGTARWMLRELRLPESQGVGFYSALDADSEGEEGKFYVWTREELDAVLLPAQARLAALHFGVGATEGAEPSEPGPLLRVMEPREVADISGLPVAAVQASLKESRARLLEARVRRAAPRKDTKFLAAWNGLAVSGLVWAALALAASDGATEPVEIAESETVARAARQTFDFLVDHLSHGDRLHSTYQEGRPLHEGQLDDYAFVAAAALDLTRIEKGDSRLEELLRRAAGWCSLVVSRFRDPSTSGYFMTADDHEQLIRRPKSVFDQAIPSGTGVLLRCLVLLSEAGTASRDELDFAAEAEHQLNSLLSLADRAPSGFGETLNAALLFKRGPVVVSGAGSEALLGTAGVIRKPAPAAAGDRLLVCHSRTCREFPRGEAGAQEARQWLTSTQVLKA